MQQAISFLHALHKELHQHYPSKTLYTNYHGYPEIIITNDDTNTTTSVIDYGLCAHNSLYYGNLDVETTGTTGKVLDSASFHMDNYPYFSDPSLIAAIIEEKVEKTYDQR